MADIFQHRHYVAMAAIIAKMPDPTARAVLADYFASELHGTNKSFDRDRFVTAAMNGPMNDRDIPGR